MNFHKLLENKSNDNFGSKQPVIAFLGDSVTQGCFEIYRSGEILKTEFDSTNNYSAKVQKILSVLYPESPVSIINAGINGGSAENGLERLQRDVLHHNPDLVVVCFGLNDSNMEIEGIGKYKDSLNSIFKTLNDKNIETIFMTPNMMNTYTGKRITDDLAKNLSELFSKRQNDGVFDKYIDAARECCVENDIKICDCYKIWKQLFACGVDTTNLLSNGLNHPIREMHYLFAYELVRTIFQIE